MKQKLSSFLKLICSDLYDTWQKSKIFIFAIGAIIVTLEFNKIKEYILLYQSKKELIKNDNENSSLQSQENAANNEANTLIQQANKLPSQESQVTEDWYTKENK